MFLKYLHENVLWCLINKIDSNGFIFSYWPLPVNNHREREEIQHALVLMGGEHNGLVITVNTLKVNLPQNLISFVLTGKPEQNEASLRSILGFQVVLTVSRARKQLNHATIRIWKIFLCL